MTWFRVDDHLHAHRKAMRAGTEAMGLWILAGSWSAAEESDGWVPAYVVTRLVGADRAEPLATLLVLAGLWHEDVVDSEEGYRFHQWNEHQPTRAQLDERREANRERMRRARSQGGKVRPDEKHSADAVHAHTVDSVDDVRSTPTRPDPSINNTAADAADFDAWWTAYPRKIGKGAAVKAYTKARKIATAQELLGGLTNATTVWRAARTEERFIPHASTWLNRESWTDVQDLLPGTVPEQPARPTVVLMQCNSPECPGIPHRWNNDHHHCQGA